MNLGPNIKMRLGLTSDKGKRYVYSLLDQLVVSGANFASVVMVARCFAAESYAQFYFIFLSMQFVMNVFQLTLVSGPISILSYKISSMEERKSYFSSAIVSQFLVGVVSSLIISFILIYNGIYDSVIYSIITISFFFMQLHELYRCVLFSKVSIDRVFLADLIAYSLRIVLIAAMVTFYDGTSNVNGIILSMGFSSFVGAMIAFYLADINILLLFDKNRIINDFKFSKWLFLDALLSSLSYRAYIIIIARFVGHDQFATFATCSLVSQVFNIILVGIFNVATPLAAKKYNSSPAALQQFVSFLRTYGGGGMLGLSFGVYTLHNFIFKVIFNNKFHDYETVLLLLLVANVAFFYQSVNVMIAKVWESPQIITFSRFVTAVFSLTVGLLLAKYYSMQGVALTITISAIVSWVILNHGIVKNSQHQLDS